MHVPVATDQGNMVSLADTHVFNKLGFEVTVTHEDSTLYLISECKESKGEPHRCGSHMSST